MIICKLEYTMIKITNHKLKVVKKNEKVKKLQKSKKQKQQLQNAIELEKKSVNLIKKGRVIKVILKKGNMSALYLGKIHSMIG